MNAGPKQNTRKSAPPISDCTLCLLADGKTSAGRELDCFPSDSPVPVAHLKRWELIGRDSPSGIRRQLERHFAAGQLYFVAEGGGWTAAKEYARAGLGAGDRNRGG
jgi:hypothetical protein